MSLAFFRNFGRAKGNDAVRSAIDAIVRWDPKGASEAELLTMEERLDNLGKKVNEAQVNYNREKAEADKIKAEYGDRLQAIKILKDEADAAIDPAVKEAKTASLRAFIAKTEELKPRVQAEIKDEVDTKALFDMLFDAYKTAGTKLRDARANLQRAQRDMESAGQRKAAAEARTEAAREAAGLVNATSSVDTALNAMRQATAQSEAEAGLLDEKSKLLVPADITQDDPNVAAAMRAAQGKKVPASLDDEIAALSL